MTDTTIKNNKAKIKKLSSQLFNNYNWLRKILQKIPENDDLILLDVKFPDYETAHYYTTKHYFFHPSLEYSLHKRQQRSTYYNYYLDIFEDNTEWRIIISVSNVKHSSSSSAKSSAST
jgi:hypothetical protein